MRPRIMCCIIFRKLSNILLSSTAKAALIFLSDASCDWYISGLCLSYLKISSSVTVFFLTFLQRSESKLFTLPIRSFSKFSSVCCSWFTIPSRKLSMSISLSLTSDLVSNIFKKGNFHISYFKSIKPLDYAGLVKNSLFISFLLFSKNIILLTLLCICSSIFLIGYHLKNLTSLTESNIVLWRIHSANDKNSVSYLSFLCGSFL